LSEIPTNLSMAAAHWRRGQILEKLGRKDEAVASITKAVSMDQRLEDAKKDLERLKKA
jgi:tetratricopeptide (TPR) repeat protein